MLKEIKERNEKKFNEFFQKTFGEGYKVETNWGFPNTVVTLTSTESKNHWRFTVNTETEEFFIESKGNDGKEQEWNGIDGKTLSFIIGNIINLNKEIFDDGSEQNTEEKK